MRNTMKFKKIMLILITAIFLLSIASVCASDVNDTAIASEDTIPLEITQSDEISVNNDNQAIEQSNDEEKISEGKTGTFSELQNNISKTSGDTLELDRNYVYDEGFDTNGIIIDKKITIDGKGHTIDAQGKSRVFNVQANDVTIKNLTLTNVNYNGDGGAVYFNQSGSVINCNFISNKGTDAYSRGGAIYFSGSGSVINCNFVNNTATFDGGAIHMISGSVTNCNFVNNAAECGGAISMSSGSVANCNFEDNTAEGGGAISMNSGSVANCNFAHNTVVYDGGAIWMKDGTVTDSKFINNVGGSSGAIFSQQWCGVIADTCIFKTDSDTTFNADVRLPTLKVDNFTTYYKSGKKLTFDLKTNSSMPVYEGIILISVYHKNSNKWVGNYSCLSGKGWTIDLPVGSYYAVFNTEYAGFKPISRTITVNKSKTQLSAKAVTATYNFKKNLVITLKDANGKALRGVKVTVKIKKAKTYSTDKNGQIRINVAKFVPKKYSAKISFAGNDKYTASSAKAKVTVKKAKPKMVAKKKSFKAKAKTKKYAVTLKNNKGKAIKKAKVTLKIKGKKAITAKTNNKGVATFIVKLTKKGTFKSTVTFKGNKYYNKVTKKVNIKIK